MIARAISDREFSFEKADFDFIAGLIKTRAGIVLGDNKQDMVYGRLSRRLRVLGMRSFREYCDFVASPRGNEELLAFLNALTTNLTKFFREKHHFDHLAASALPAKVGRVEAGHEPRRLRIWSAAASSGEEPYSIAMVVLDTLRDIGRWDARILATDIDTRMVETCQAGLYDRERAKTIPEPLKCRFVKPAAGEPGKVRMSEELRSLIVFKRLNLLGPWPMKGPFDVIFCRNVAIYFDKPTQKVLFERMADLLSDDGFLYIGHAENLFNVTKKFKILGQTIYEKA